MVANKRIKTRCARGDTYSLAELVPRNYSQQVSAGYLGRYISGGVF